MTFDQKTFGFFQWAGQELSRSSNGLHPCIEGMLVLPAFDDACESRATAGGLEAVLNRDLQSDKVPLSSNLRPLPLYAHPEGLHKSGPGGERPQPPLRLGF